MLDLDSDDESIQRKDGSEVSSHDSMNSSMARMKDSSFDLEVYDSTNQHEFDELMDDKNFIFSKIKNEYITEFRLLNDLRRYPKPASEMLGLRTAELAKSGVSHLHV